MNKQERKIASLDDVLTMIRNRDRALESGDVYAAMESAVILHPLHEVLSQYKKTPATERCTMLLQAYVTYLQGREVPNCESRAYENFAVALGHHSSTETSASTRHYRTWRPVLDKFQEEHKLPRVSWFN